MKRASNNRRIAECADWETCGSVKMWYKWGRCGWGARGFRGAAAPLLMRPLQLTTKRTHSDIRSSFITFDNVIKERKNQAKRSILVQVNSEKSFSELHSYCSQFGKILDIYHYIVPNNQHFMLVEFTDEDQVSNVISSATYTEDLSVIPVQSSFLWFRPPKLKTRISIKNFIDLKTNIPNHCLKVKNGCEPINDEHVMQEILKANDLTEQIEILYNSTRLGDLETRLRFIAARQIETTLIGLYPNIAVYPFGSSVNGFGNVGCDLDLILKFTIENPKDNIQSRLVFHTKKSTLKERSQQQQCMEIIADLIQHFAPGCSHIRRILQARVPIIKYNQDYTGMECDLSVNSLSGLYMSELLYIFGNFDSRVRPLVFTIRKWAKVVGLTNSSPGKWITNFPLTLMALFFLQNAPGGPILPSMNHLKSHADESDVRITSDSIDCTFSRNIKDDSFKTSNTANLEVLLTQFFEFYSTFDFSAHAISINEGRITRKRDHSALYIINPLETSLNVSKNVSYDECEKLKNEVKNAAWYLDTSKNNTEKFWGLGYLLRTDSMYNTVFSNRLLSVKDLFTNEEKHIGALTNGRRTLNNNNNNEQRIQVVSKTQDPQTPKPIVFNNASVEKEIREIQRQTAENIRRAQMLHSDDVKDDNSLSRRGRKVRRR